MSNGDTFTWIPDLRTGSPQAKSPLVQSQYPPRPTYRNPGQATYKLSDSKHIREYAQKMIGKANQVLGPKAQELFQQGQNITQSTAIGSPITDVIKQWDQKLKTEAQGNGNVLQMLTKLRQELNMPDMQKFFGQAMQGQFNNIQSLLGGQLMGVFTQMLSLVQQTGQQQNNNQANNVQTSTIKAIDANGNIISIT